MNDQHMHRGQLGVAVRRDDAAGIIVSNKSAEGLCAKMMTVNVTVFEAAGLTVSEK